MSSRKQIIRLESLPGVGIYTSPKGATTKVKDKIDQIRSLMCDYFGDNLADPAHHPGPYDDKKLSDRLTKNDLFKSNVFYGFKDAKQLRKWFYSVELLESLDHEGVTIACYRVTETFDGKFQTCARSEEKKPENVVWRITPREFMDKGIPVVDKA